MAEPQPSKASKQALPPFQHSIATDQELEQKLAEPGIKVVELHSWAGPCKAVVNAFKRLHFEHEDEAVLQFLSVDADKCTLIEETKQHASHCAPKFLVYKNGILKKNIDGANSPAVDEAIKASLAEDLDPTQSLRETVENPFAAAIAARGAAAQAAEREVPKGEFKQLLAAVASEGAEAPLGSAA